MDDKVAIITGAASGIGRSCARLLSSKGVRLILVDLSAEKLHALRGLLPSESMLVVGSIAEAATSEQAVRVALEEFGRLDIVVANAGVYLGGEFAETLQADIEQVISINVYGAMATVRAALPHLLANGVGDVLVTSSISGHMDIHVEPVYSASKSAIQTFVHAVRRQIAGSGVRVGAIAPGVVLSPLWGFEEGATGIEEKVAEGAGVRSDDVADAMLFMLTRPPHVTIRDLVILPTNQEI